MITKKKDREKQAAEMVNYLNGAFEQYPEVVDGRYKLVDMLPGKKMVLAILCFFISGASTVGLCIYGNSVPHDGGVISVLIVVGMMVGVAAFVWSAIIMLWCMLQPPCGPLVFDYSEESLEKLAKICCETSAKIQVRFVAQARNWPIP